MLINLFRSEFITYSKDFSTKKAFKIEFRVKSVFFFLKKKIRLNLKKEPITDQ